MGKSVTRALAEFVGEAHYENLPQSEVERIKMAFLETLGCMILGSTNSSGKTLMKLAGLVGGEGASLILGTKIKTSPPYAALVNGTMGHRYEYDDGISPAMGLHAGIAITPAVLAIGEMQSSTGSDIITAMTVGYETACRIGRAMAGIEGYRHLHSTVPLGTFGATVAVCKLLNLSVSEINNAIGICGALDSATPFEPFIGGAMVKDMYGGWPGFIGVFIGLLAQQGFTGLENILEAELGFFQVWTGGRFHASSILDDLGETYIWPQGHYFKPHSACRGVHLPIDCMLEMLKVEKIEVGKIEEILVIAKPEIAYHMRGGPDPKNSIQSRVSLNYAVAAAAVFGGDHLGPEAFDDEALKNPLILELAKKVRVVSVPEPDILHIHGHGPVEIIIRFKDGRTRIGHYPDDRSLKPKDIPKKFKEMALKVLSDEQVTEIIHIVNELESLGNVRSLVKLLVG